MKMKAGVLTVCGAPRPFAKSKPIHVLEVDLDPPGDVTRRARRNRSAR